jgi:pimeloyl-ACP methyl ester carboxylesterase
MRRTPEHDRDEPDESSTVSQNLTSEDGVSRRRTLQSIGVLGALGLTGTANVASAASSDEDEDEDEDEENENSDSLENSDLDEDTFSSEMIEVDDVELHYVIGGDGPPVVLVHGWPQTWYEWQNVMPELAEDYTVVAPDLRGAGDSEVTAAGYDKRTMAEDIRGIGEALDGDRIDFVGHDIGGMVGYAYANEYPETLRSYTILDVPLPGIEPIWSTILQSPESWHFGFHATPDLPETLVGENVDVYLSDFFARMANDPLAITGETLDAYVDAYSDPENLRGGFEYYRAFPADVRQNQIYAESQLELPVLALGGAASAGPFMTQLMNQVATDVRGGSISSSGHWITEEQPDALTARLLDFLANNN